MFMYILRFRYAVVFCLTVWNLNPSPVHKPIYFKLWTSYSSSMNPFRNPIRLVRFVFFLVTMYMKHTQGHNTKIFTAWLLIKCILFYTVRSPMTNFTIVYMYEYIGGGFSSISCKNRKGVNKSTRITSVKVGSSIDEKTKDSEFHYVNFCTFYKSKFKSFVLSIFSLSLPPRTSPSVHCLIPLWTRGSSSKPENRIQFFIDNF